MQIFGDSPFIETKAKTPNTNKIVETSPADAFCVQGPQSHSQPDEKEGLWEYGTKAAGLYFDEEAPFILARSPSVTVNAW